MPLDREADESAERCLYCPKMCSFSCPVAHESGREALTPWGKMTLLSLSSGPGGAPSGRQGPLEALARKARGLLDGASSRPLDADTAEAFYGCSGCLRCRTFCDHENDVPQALYQGRAQAVDKGLAPAAATAVADRFARKGHARDEDVLAAVDAVAMAHSLPRAATSMLFAGCEAPVSSPAAVSATLRSAARLGAPVGLVQGQACCGRPLFEGGFRDAFRDHVQEAWQRLGTSEVVVLSAGCGRALTEYAREVGVEPRGVVVHSTTYLAGRLGPEVQATQLPVSATFHDPCHLGRGLGEYEAPRRLLSAALAEGVREPPATRAESDCCGASGLLPATFPDVARAMALSRADGLRGRADRVVTACPSCRTALRAAGLDVADVSEIVAEWLGVD